jgi:hypothetical protein
MSRIDSYRSVGSLARHRSMIQDKGAGQKTPWKELLPADRVGLIRFENVFVTPDGKHYAYSLNRVTDSDLYVVTGWK